MPDQLAAVPIDGGFVVKRTPGRVHASFDKAASEAVRLTGQDAGKPSFMVMKVVGVVIDASAASPEPRASDEAVAWAAGCARNVDRESAELRERIAQTDSARLGIDDPEGTN